jgi:hypothetical protein
MSKKNIEWTISVRYQILELESNIEFNKKHFIKMFPNTKVRDHKFAFETNTEILQFLTLTLELTL